MTNDGDFADLVTHPRYGVAKTYEALVEGAPGRRELAALRRGVELEDGPARALAVRRIGSDGRRTHLEIDMGEGRNREVRRMCAAAGFPVVRLHRSSIGPLRAGALRPRGMAQAGGRRGAGLLQDPGRGGRVSWYEVRPRRIRDASVRPPGSKSITNRRWRPPPWPRGSR